MNIDLFHLGPQKSATTWVYQSLKEHPEILTSYNDTVHYYDIYYHKGEKWYKSHFPQSRSDKKTFDPTYTYLRSPWAPRRIAKDNPDAKFLLCLRNPIDRAFSHYWHEKKKQKIAFEFHEVLENYDLYSSWIEPGLYGEHIERYLKYFDRDQILFLRFENLKKDPKTFLSKILSFIEVDPNFKPSTLNKKSNAAKGKYTFTRKVWVSLKDKVINTRLERPLRKLNVDEVAKNIEALPLIGKLLNDKDEYERGVPEDVKDELLELIEPEIERLENLLNIKLDNWRK